MISKETMERVNRLTEEGRSREYSQQTLDEIRQSHVRTVLRIDRGWKDRDRPPIERSERRSMHEFWPLDDPQRFDIKCYLRNRK